MPLAHGLDSMVAPLDVVLFGLGRDTVSWAELLGFATGVLGVWLTVRSNIWNFPERGRRALIHRWHGRVRYETQATTTASFAVAARRLWPGTLPGGRRDFGYRPSDPRSDTL